MARSRKLARFVARNALADSLIINLSAGHLYVVSALLPKDRIEEGASDDLLGWSYDPSSSRSICALSEDAWIEDPISGRASKSLEGDDPQLVDCYFVDTAASADT
ncbi:MAG TPA: hypothetical protein VFE10_14960 [Phenylobacterium sp.]|nr:hypothetical protein [Phenylobacterium sp.]